jgi:NADH-quinone oxidoreductase subunit J
MMLDINFAEMRRGFLKYLWFGVGIALLILGELVFAFYVSRGIAKGEPQQPLPDAAEVTNTHAVGQVLYTDYIYPFQIAGLILLVAMIGAITLTLRQRPGVKRQSAARQFARTREEGVEIVKVRPGQGA